MKNIEHTFSNTYIREAISILEAIDHEAVEKLVRGLNQIRSTDARLFILGVGGSAAHASHAVCDFRKICDIQAYTPTDNAAELTARTNDEGWNTTFIDWLRGCRLSQSDAVLVFSVGGGSMASNLSPNLVFALKYAQEVGASIFGIVGRDGGFTKEVADVCIVIPPLYADHVTPHTEGVCAIVWHLVVSHPSLKVNPTRWESATNIV
jgi:D-sedoheptulose 7-phosphate isomerase